MLCPTGALEYGEIGDEVPSTPGFNDFRIGPAVNVIPHRLPAGPEVHHMPTDIDWVEEGNEEEERTINLAGEWPLAIFTFIASVMVGMVSGVMFGEVSLSPLLFFIAGLSAGAISIIHLGKKIRAWRSVFHFRDSWLSREIVFFGLFFLTGLWFALTPDYTFIGYVSLIAGFSALFSIDRVYDVVREEHKLRVHSADTLFTGILFSAWFAGSEAILLISIAVKAALFIYQEIHRDSLKGVSAWLRVIIGFALPVVLFPIFDLTSSVFILIVLLIGEAIDRGRFYNNLQKLSL
jgi:DMSO reductase anchor subunit